PRPRHPRPDLLGPPGQAGGGRRGGTAARLGVVPGGAAGEPEPLPALAGQAEARPPAGPAGDRAGAGRLPGGAGGTRQRSPRLASTPVSGAGPRGALGPALAPERSRPIARRPACVTMYSRRRSRSLQIKAGRQPTFPRVAGALRPPR